MNLRMFILFLLLGLAGCNQQPPAAEQIELQISGMTCQNCVDGITDALVKLPGVENCAVSLEKASATVTYLPDRLNPSQIQKRINQLGFTAHLPED